jgi:small subunit ribosomal protein S4
MSKRIELPKYLRAKAQAAAATPQRGRGSKMSEYGKQLREKQKARFAYGLREKQFRNYFTRAARSGEATGELLLQLLERRLDNVLYRLSLTATRAQARQMVTHGHVLVNGVKVNVPSYLVNESDTVALVKIDPQPREVEIPTWLTFDKKKNVGTVSRMPAREDIDLDLNEQLIVEFYSR